MCIYHIFFIHLYVDGHLGFFHVLCVLNHFSHVHLYVTVQTTASQAPLSMGFSRQEYWSGLLCPSPGDLLNPGIESTSPVSPSLQEDSLPLRQWGSLRPKLHEDKHHLSLNPERTKRHLMTAHGGRIQITGTGGLCSSGRYYGGHGSPA